MDSFIVRVYRRTRATGELVGTVEDVARHCTEPFRTFKELKRALKRAHPDEPGGPETRSPGRRKKSGPAGESFSHPLVPGRYVVSTKQSNRRR